jgi:hypothetical protein
MALTSRAPFARNQFTSFALLNVKDPPPPAGTGTTAPVVSSLNQNRTGPSSPFEPFNRFRPNPKGFTPLPGAGSIVEGQDVVSGAGSQSTAGSGAIVEGADVVAGTGSQSSAPTVSSLNVLQIGPQSRANRFRSNLSASFTAPPPIASGSGAINESADVVAGAGTQSTSGAGAIVESGDIVTGSGSGAAAAPVSSLNVLQIGPQSRANKFRSRLAASFSPPPVVGSGSIAEQSDVVAGAGSFPVPIVSSLSSANLGPHSHAPFNLNQFKALQQGATSQPTITGSGSIAESSDVVAGTGASSLSGTGAINESADVVAGAGGVLGQGSGAIVENADVVSGSGGQSTSGSGAIVESADVVAGVGSQSTSGSGAIAEPADVMAGAGSQSTAGSGAIVEGADTASGSGTSGSSAAGAGSILESPDVVAGSATAAMIASGAIVEPSDVMAGSGSKSISGSGAVSESQDAVSGTGYAGAAPILFGGPRYIVRRRYGRLFTTSALMSLRFDEKMPGELVKVTFDFTPDLAVLPFGILLQGSPTVTVTMAQGTDPSPNAILNGSAGLNAAFTQVIVPVQAGLDLCDYRILVVIATTDPETTLELDGVLPVRLLRTI